MLEGVVSYLKLCAFLGRRENLPNSNTESLKATTMGSKGNVR